jgi:hypothetical protein
MIKEEEKEISFSFPFSYVAMKEVSKEEEKEEISSSSSFFVIEKETMAFGEDLHHHAMCGGWTF